MANRYSRDRISATRRIALGGIFSALALVILLAGGFISIGTFAAPIFAGIALLPIAVDLGARWALLCYTAVAVLGFLTVPDQELILFFLALFGYYPILQPTLNRLKSRVLRWALKLLMFNAAAAAVYSVMLMLFTGGTLRKELAGRAVWFLGILLLLGNLTFLLYDTLLDKVRILYHTRIRRHLFR